MVQAHNFVELLLQLRPVESVAYLEQLFAFVDITKKFFTIFCKFPDLQFSLSLRRRPLYQALSKVFNMSRSTSVVP